MLARDGVFGAYLCASVVRTHMPERWTLPWVQIPEGVVTVAGRLTSASVLDT